MFCHSENTVDHSKTAARTLHDCPSETHIVLSLARYQQVDDLRAFGPRSM